MRRFARALLRGDREAADDLVQDSLERALSRWHQRRRDGDLRSWVYTILYHRFVSDRHRQRRRGGHRSLSELQEAEQPGAEGGQDAALARRDLLRGLATLSEEQRSVLLLVGVEDFSYEEAAHILGVPTGTVMSRLSRGRERLRRYMNGDCVPTRQRPPTPPPEFCSQRLVHAALIVKAEPLADAAARLESRSATRGMYGKAMTVPSSLRMPSLRCRLSGEPAIGLGMWRAPGAEASGLSRVCV